jgi:hypothetical protein
MKGLSVELSRNTPVSARVVPVIAAAPTPTSVQVAHAGQ